MSLTYGSGPFGQQPAGRFNLPLPREGVAYLEELPRWIRARFEGETVVDSRRPRLLHEHARLPVFYFPRADVRMELLRPSERRERDATKGEGSFWSLAVGKRVAPDAAWSYAGGDGLSELGELVAFRWDAIDEWLEEDEPLYGHARDPYSRIDVRPTSRHVRVSLGGETVADTRRAKVLFEAGLPPRWYIPEEDVRTELLEASAKSTACAYKGFASYWHVRAGNVLHEDLVWTYREPLHDAAQVRDMLAFFNERVELELDGEPQERPRTQWSPAR